MQYIPSRTPLAHSSSHEHGGSDEVATATPTANAIPKADSAGRISSGWLPDVQTVADMAARHALTVAFKVKQTDTGHIYVFLGGDITSEADWMDLGHYNIAPSNTAVPTITGTAQVDVQLTAVEGTYAGYPTPSHASWQWQVSDTGTSGWSDISGATSSTYTPVSADEGKYLRAKEGQSNIVGTVYACSAATAAVAGASNPSTQLWFLDPPTEGWGINYQVDDVVSVTDGTPVSEALHGQVAAVGSSGEITSWNPSGTPSAWYYDSNLPTSPAAVTGGNGSGAMVNIGGLP